MHTKPTKNRPIPTAAQLRQVKARRQELQNSNALPDPLVPAATGR